MKKVLAFDVSETLQTGSEYNDNGLGQPMVMGNEVIPGAYSVMVGGLETAKLLKQAQEKGIVIVLVTNNGADLDKEVIQRTLDFFRRYGVTIPAAHYMGPPAKDNNGSKVPRLESLLQLFNVSKDEILFFDDSANNVAEAIEAGFQSIRVKTPADLQKGILDVLNAPAVEKAVEKKTFVSAAQEGFFAKNEWDQFDADFKCYVSVATRDVRVVQYNHMITSDYWERINPAEREKLFLGYTEETAKSYTL